MVWEEGFASGELQGEFYDDVEPALVRWQSLGIRTYIYSRSSSSTSCHIINHLYFYTSHPLLWATAKNFISALTSNKEEA